MVQISVAFNKVDKLSLQMNAVKFDEKRKKHKKIFSATKTHIYKSRTPQKLLGQVLGRANAMTDFNREAKNQQSSRALILNAQ